MAGAWNKLRDGWFALCMALGADDIIEKACFGKVMRLMAGDVAQWHVPVGGRTHGDTDVWATLPLPWRVLAGDETCTRAELESACTRFGVNPLKSGWLARLGERKVAEFTPTPELVRGVVVASPAMARAMRKAGVFSGKAFKPGSAVVDLDTLIAEVEQNRHQHWHNENSRRQAGGDDAGLDR